MPGTRGLAAPFKAISDPSRRFDNDKAWALVEDSGRFLNLGQKIPDESADRCAEYQGGAGTGCSRRITRRGGAIFSRSGPLSSVASARCLRVAPDCCL